MFSGCRTSFIFNILLVAGAIWQFGHGGFAQTIDGCAENACLNDGCAGTSLADSPCFDECCTGKSPGTLFQWSYGNSFEGGPPGYDEPLVTDRPDFTEASTTVGLGVAQLEMGYTYSYDSDDGVSTRGQTYPEPLLRYGIYADWLELRLGWTYVEERVVAGGVRSHVSDSAEIYAGLKIALTPQECCLPEMALIPQMLIPAGGDISADEVLPGVNWIYAWELSDNISTAGSSQINRALDTATNEPYMSFAQSWTVGYSLTEQLGAYTEWFAIIPTGADTDPTVHFFNGGFTYLLNNNLQYDIRAGVGLNKAADDYFAGTGVSMRF